MMDKHDDDKLRKANLRVAIILGVIAVAGVLYTFLYLPKVMSGGGMG
ncbi:hypothetical protein [Thiothrix nivea]|uniref:Uncharacterized protein n=1 Tax=Thiothrix nivea (strain ATCC 35100 / DSM 5205 / JP2) TaxID=870187 RepID=A0A656HB46_THINJ|nr:hypothetical protein [Thiothrix nivea]EIJ33513.1 hypothetical protein Thini_0885 [Thiothrix nivea DSM 5205]